MLCSRIYWMNCSPGRTARRRVAKKNPVRGRGLLPLEGDGRALAEADAERGEALLRIALGHLVDERHGQARAGGTERVAKGDCAAVDVELLLGDAELAAGVHRLAGERLVQFDEVEVVDGLAGALQQAARRRDGTDAHHGRVDARDVVVADVGHYVEAVLLGEGLAGDERRGRAVGDLRGVTRGDRPVADEDARQALERLHARVGADALVLLDETVLGLDGDDLVVEAAGLRRLGGALVAPKRVLVLCLAGDLVLFGDLLGRHPHLEFGEVVLLVEFGVEAATAVGALHRDEGHVLDAARDDGVALARPDGVARTDDRLHRGGTPAVDGRAGHALAQVREERDDARDVVVLFLALLGDAPHQVVDVLARQPRLLQDVVDERDREVLAARVGEHAVLLTLRGSYCPCDDRYGVATHGRVLYLRGLKLGLNGRKRETI